MSGQPLGKPLYPMPKMTLSAETMHAPTCSPGTSLRLLRGTERNRCAKYSCAHLLVGVLGALCAQERHCHEVLIPAEVVHSGVCLVRVGLAARFRGVSGGRRCGMCAGSLGSQRGCLQGAAVRGSPSLPTPEQPCYVVGNLWQHAIAAWCRAPVGSSSGTQRLSEPKICRLATRPPACPRARDPDSLLSHQTSGMLWLSTLMLMSSLATTATRVSVDQHSCLLQEPDVRASARLQGLCTAPGAIQRSQRDGLT